MNHKPLVIERKTTAAFVNQNVSVHNPLICQRQIPLSTTKPLIQPKLKIGAPNDKYEQEADRIADRVAGSYLHSGSVSLQAKSRPSISRLQAGAMPLQRTLESPGRLEDGILQTKSRETMPVQTWVDLETGLSNLGNGSTLPTGERDKIEQVMGFDFSAVRIHSDQRSAALANSIRARAFTLGKNIVFGQGEYLPGTIQGRRLLAHELTHVVQQGQAHSNASLQQHVSPILSDHFGAKTIRRMAWNPNTDTGRDVAPWSSLPNITGDLLNAATDAGTAVHTWFPHDRSTYWCHGYTFGGSTARGGPYSVWGSTVPQILSDDSWRRISYCNARNNDILVFYGRANTVSGPAVRHSGIIRSVSRASSALDETSSTLESKWGSGSHNTKTWSDNVSMYGFYRIYSKTEARSSSCGTGPNELP